MPTMKRRAPDAEPATASGKRSRARTDAFDPSELAQGCVAAYLDRFRNVPKGKNELGGGMQKKPDSQIIRQLQRLAKNDGNVAIQCDHLNEFTRANGVNRSFTGVAQENTIRLRRLLKPLRQSHANLASGRLGMGEADLKRITQEVNRNVDACSAAGFTRNVSYASKVLCVLGHNAPMYSREVREYLSKHAGTVTTPSYGVLVKAWAREFERHGTSYVAAARDLITPEEEEWLGAQWFAMRGFDHMMMEWADAQKKKKK